MICLRSLLAIGLATAAWGYSYRQQLNFTNGNDLRLLGRFDLTDPNHPRADWPGTGVAFSLVATEATVGISFELQDCTGNCLYYLQTSLNCAPDRIFAISPSSTVATWWFQTTIGEKYDISIVKRTESSCSDAKGTMVLKSLTILGGTSIPPNTANSCSQSSLRMLVIGDSITAGYGVEGNMPCVFSADTENVLEAWAFLTAEALNLELHSVAFSGKGVVRNYGDSSPVSSNPMPIYYNRTLALDSSIIWDPARFAADVVAVMLGANDYSTEPSPSDEQFVSGYVEFLRVIQSDYKNATVIAMCSPHHIGPQCANIQRAAELTGSEYIFVDESALTSYGCDYHPSIEAQINTANLVIPQLKKLLDL